MAYGMSYAEFWHANPRILGVYIRAYNEKVKLMDEQMWAAGHYVLDAVYVAVGKLFVKKFNAEYPIQPVTAPKKTIEEMEEIEAERQMKQMILAEEMWVVRGKQMGLPQNK